MGVFCNGAPRLHRALHNSTHPRLAASLPQEIDQLHKIFQLLGTPDEAMWAGCSALPDFKDTFPKWRPQNLGAAVPTLSPEGVDLLARMLVYTPQHR